MASGYIVLPALAWVPLDGSSGNEAAELDFVQHDSNRPAPRFARWAFDKNEPVESIAVSFRVPAHYAGAPRLKLHWYTTQADSCQVVWRVTVSAVSPGEAVLHGNADAVDQTASGNASGALSDVDIDLSPEDDDLAAGDVVSLVLTRNTEDFDDLLNDDAYFLGAVFEYTAG